jgi:hypothetical protein
MAEGEEPEGVLDGTEQGVMVDLLGITARMDVVADNDRRYRLTVPPAFSSKVMTSQPW